MQTAPAPLFLGGSFNPPHCGHLRLAIECAEAFCNARLYFIPCALPPHKEASGLLPFALRCALLRACIASLGQAGLRERLAVSEVENERSGPSYTIETLRILGERHPGRRPLFILGSEDYARLNSWRDWRLLPEYADLLVLPRPPAGPEDFERQSAGLWPKARPMSAEERRASGLPAGIAQAFELPGGARMLFLPQPLLDISSSLARARWLEGRSPDFLLPEAVLRLLAENEDQVRQSWLAAP